MLTKTLWKYYPGIGHKNIPLSTLEKTKTTNIYKSGWKFPSVGDEDEEQ